MTWLFWRVSCKTVNILPTVAENRIKREKIIGINKNDIC